MHKYKYTNTNTQIQIQEYKYTNTQIHKYKNTNYVQFTAAIRWWDVAGQGGSCGQPVNKSQKFAQI